MNKLKEIVILSGKGGTGKTTVASSLAAVMKDIVIADADVDAANMHILLKPEIIKEEDFTGKSIAIIDNDICTSCDICRNLCRFDAIDVVNDEYIVDEISCDGCTLCEVACPVDAIRMEEQIVGKWFLSKTDYGEFVYAKLNPGAENSGNLVTMVKHQSKRLAESKGINKILIDGPPGIGCPVTSSLSGAFLSILVTEPTLSGMSDLERILKLTKHFNVITGIVINRFDINLENSKKIEDFAKEHNIEVFAKIPHSHCILDEITNRNIPVFNCNELKVEIEKIVLKINQYIEEKNES